MAFMCILMPTSISDDTQQRKELAITTEKKIKKSVRDLMARPTWSSAGSFSYHICTLL